MIRGNKRRLPRTDIPIALDLRASIHNRFDVEVIDAATGELRQKAVGYNTICAGLWDRLLAVNGSGQWTPQLYFRYVLYGGGNGTPEATDTTLFSQIGYIQLPSSNGSVSITPTMDRRTGVITAEAVVTLQAEDAVGETITEVGIGYDTTHVATHALLQDMNGNPISIEKTATDVIKIYAVLYVHWPDAGWYGGAINVSEPFYPIENVLHGFFMKRLCGLLAPPTSVNYDGFNIASIGSGVSPQFTGALNRISPTVNRAAQSLTFAKRLAAADNNVPIRAMRLFFTANTQSVIDGALWITMGSWYTPAAITGEAIGTGDGSTKVFATAFPVKTAGTVYVDGAAASGVTMRPGAPKELMRYLNTIEGLSASGTPLYIYDSSAYHINDVITANWSQRSGPIMLENPFYAVGIGSFGVGVTYGSVNGKNIIFSTSDDCVVWSEAARITGTSATEYGVGIPAAHQNKRFWRISTDSTATLAIACGVPDGNFTGNILFETAPAASSVITADYTPDCIAKDENHVFDVSVTLTFGEYQE